jgi:hypothetical protein
MPLHGQALRLPRVTRPVRPHRPLQISYFGAHAQLPLGVALLFAAVLGMLLAAIPGTARIIQLRILARRHRAIDARAAGGTPGTAAGNPAPGGPGPDGN